MLLSEGQMSDYKGAAYMLSSFPAASELLADKGYDADWFREALEQRDIKPCIPPKQSQGPDPLRQGSLQVPTQDRKHVRKAERLAPHPYTL